MRPERYHCILHVAIFEIGEKQKQHMYVLMIFGCSKLNTGYANGRWWNSGFETFRKIRSESRMSFSVIFTLPLLLFRRGAIIGDGYKIHSSAPSNLTSYTTLPFQSTKTTALREHVCPVFLQIKMRQLPKMFAPRCLPHLS